MGSPYAIGSPDGGHDAIHPDLGTMEDFDAFVARAKELGLEVAMDIALQCSPDHPWVQEHPEWFVVRADGTIVAIDFGIMGRINRQARYSEVFEDDLRPALDSLRALIAESRIEMPEGIPPVAAGLFGYLGYDMIRLVEHLPHVNPDPIGVPDAMLMRRSVVAVLVGLSLTPRTLSGPVIDSNSPLRDDRGHNRVGLGGFSSRGRR